MKRTALRWGFLYALGLILVAVTGFVSQAEAERLEALQAQRQALAARLKALEAARAQALSPAVILAWAEAQGFIPMSVGRWEP
ncbi:hypothetical protein [Marinithermus hydrothermalis]|uniref:Septum formation initiator n=1 Tax=Marinithermus hydrothermalis (strain DSM 14884 / JCM 11576 / T1) TaxID=869210 RepID=F2NMK7_MARHT|nr:hypothetical protein [Marinithermus hydrothermalis]AEB12177.1 hypothetical protein Marky_1442 [Marinithermus hydrothermalis DSM 14884]